MTGPRLFGTDGIRGVFGREPLDRDTVTRLGWHLAAVLRQRTDRPLVIIGGDTREGTPRLCRWLAAGLTANGAAIRYAGVLPTPGVAFLARRLGAACGVAVSASHNPHPDNGIKLLTGDGFKWTPQEETALEERLRAHGDGVPPAEPQLRPESELARLYLEALAASLPEGRPLEGLGVVLDAANGAAAPHAAGLFASLGAQVEMLGDAPDGRNINRERGSTRPEAMAAATVRGGYQLGIAFDGDADRAILADETGRVRDGDAILYLWAAELAAQGRLQPPRIVATTMSNLGLERALAPHGVAVERCGVGDREVVTVLLAEGLTLGGEQSGHVVNLALSTTGDGLLTALAMSHLAVRRARPLSRLLAGFARFPQVLLNVPVARKVDFADLPAVAAKVHEIEGSLGSQGRLVLRYSGTEPLARIMIEGPEQPAIESMAGELAREIGAALG